MNRMISVGNTHLKLVTPAIEKRTVTPRRAKNADLRTREYLTEQEVERSRRMSHPARGRVRAGTPQGKTVDMPRGPKGEKRTADVIGNAVRVMRIATQALVPDVTRCRVSLTHARASA
jgi:hypothetical protein